MSTIAECAYDAKGRLIQPDASEVRTAKIALDFDTGRPPTFDRGYTHVYVLSETGRGSAHAHRRMTRLLARFFGEAEIVPGFRTISMKKTQGYIYCNHNIQIIYEIVYAVEPPAWARGRNPEPSTRFSRGRGPSVVAAE